MHFALGSSFGKKLVAASLMAVVMATATTPADARPRKSKAAQSSSRSSDDGGNWKRGTAALIIDANTGRVLYEDNADALRHPASLTKIMTLYMLFEQLETGRLSLGSDLPVSAHASSQSPTKLGLRPGSTLEVEDAIKAVVTRSANDAAVVIGEAIGGTESNFAAMMTRKARALGMDNTTFRNASGLPNPGQVTTARDLAILGRAIQERFPRQYRYFSTRSFVFRGQTIGNHNRLMARMEGVDGIKTGYTNASGFNLVTSLHKDDRYLIGVVLGGSSAASRDNRMAGLLSSNFNRAYAGNRTAPRIVETASRDADVPRPAPAPDNRPSAPQLAQAQPALTAPLPPPQRMAYAAADPVTTASVSQNRAPAPGSTEPIRPVAVRTTTIGRPANAPAAAQTFSGQQAPVAGAAAPRPATLTPPGDLALAPAAVAPPEAAAVRTAASGPVALPAETVAEATTPAPRPVRVASAAPVAPAPAAHTPRSGWIIQIGAFGAEKEARARLDDARSKAAIALKGADPYTEKVEKGRSDIYRARFAGLTEKGAKDACRLLQRKDFDCMTLRN
ncbi:D-alanyl-D-alanine carboxypeptidase [Azorhizobium oxalatiphilum]|uniref:D-alanyl-D-alanine carboxypeptidase n=1 Tax=Azorhizobium oxalatiphilum TaxID=980631 RepID=A0A917C9I1_9HYPH|nr:D-alanyl-D-alanine carboxypeptidase [Azorhizobium oxalatiphilum]GGF74229.1 D-alanyl-D-alanine carboxypeptidase [Azorhizobium oxalatiphilum]